MVFECGIGHQQPIMVIERWHLVADDLDHARSGGPDGLAQLFQGETCVEAIRAGPPWHSITIAYTGRLVGGELRVEEHPRYGRKEPRWFSRRDLDRVLYHPKETIDLAPPC